MRGWGNLEVSPGGSIMMQARVMGMIRKWWRIGSGLRGWLRSCLEALE
jgi:hypothetical protein